MIMCCLAFDPALLQHEIFRNLITGTKQELNKSLHTGSFTDLV